MNRKRNLVVAVLGFVLAAAGGALAAWIFYTGATGSGGAKVGTNQISPAVTLTGTPANALTSVVPDTPGDVEAIISTAGPNANNEQVTSLTASTITASPSCNTSALHFAVNPAFLNTTLVNGQLYQVGTVTADPNLDPACAGAALTVNLAGTTSP